MTKYLEGQWKDKYFTVDAYEKRVDEWKGEEAEIRFAREESGRLRFRSLEVAQKAAALAELKHYKVLFHTEHDMFGKTVSTTVELEVWEKAENEKGQAAEKNREIRAEIMKFLTSKKTIWKETLGHYAVTFEAELGSEYRPSYSHRLQIHEDYRIVLHHKNTVQTSSTFWFRDYRTDSGNFRRKKLTEDLNYMIGCESIAIKEELKQRIIKSWPDILKARDKALAPFKGWAGNTLYYKTEGDDGWLVETDLEDEIFELLKKKVSSRGENNTDILGRLHHMVFTSQSRELKLGY